MKKTEFQKYAYSEASKLFLKLFMQGKCKRYSSEAKGDRQKIKYEQAYHRSLAIYFFRNGTIQIYQRGDFEQRAENTYYEWQDSSDYKDVAAALIKDLTEFIKRLNDDTAFSEEWAHDGFCDFAYETSKFRKSFPEPDEE
jgi:hypothetical protein